MMQRLGPARERGSQGYEEYRLLLKLLHHASHLQVQPWLLFLVLLSLSPPILAQWVVILYTCMSIYGF